MDLDDYRYLRSTRAELLRRLGRREESARRSSALGLTTFESERRFLTRQIGELSARFRCIAIDYPGRRRWAAAAAAISAVMSAPAVTRILAVD